MGIQNPIRADTLKGGDFRRVHSFNLADDGDGFQHHVTACGAK